METNGICSAAFCESAALRASACSPERADFPRPGEDVTAGDKKGNLARERLRGRGKTLTALPERVKKVGQKRPQAFLTHK